MNNLLRTLIAIFGLIVAFFAFVWVNEYFEFGETLTAFATLVMAVVAAFALVQSAKANNTAQKALDEMTHQRKQKEKPNIILSLFPDIDEAHLYLNIENVGESHATNVKIRFPQDFIDNISDKQICQPLVMSLNKSTITVAPGQVFPVYIASFSDQTVSDYHDNVTVEYSYNCPDSDNETVNGHYVFNFKEYLWCGGPTPQTITSIREISESFKHFNMNKIVKAINNIERQREETSDNDKHNESER